MKSLKRQAEERLHGLKEQLGTTQAELAMKERELSALKTLKSLNDGVDPSKDPAISDDWNSFTPEQKAIAREVAAQLAEVDANGGNVQNVVDEVLRKLDEAESRVKDPNNPTNEDVQELVNVMKKDGQQATERRFKEIYGIKDQPTTMIFKKTLEDFDRMFETKIVRVGDNYKSLDYVRAQPIPVKEARICFLPNPLPQEWNASFAEDVSEEILLGLPFQTTWIEAAGSWDKGPASSIDIDNSDGGKISIQFCGAFLKTKMIGNTPCLHVQAVMAAGAYKRGGRDYENTVFIADYDLTTHLIKWTQERVTKTDWTGVAEDEYKAYPIVGPSIFPIVGFLISLQNKQVRLGAERVNERVRTGTGKNREFHKIKEVVHVCLTRKESALPKIGVFGREIDWTHRWEISGHWRKIPEGSVGKNAAGEYGVRGFTWVVPHVKGPDDKPIVKKIRVMKE